MFIVSFHKISTSHPAHNIWHIAGITYETKYIVAWHNKRIYDTFILGLLFFSYTLYLSFLTTRVCFSFCPLSKWAGNKSSQITIKSLFVFPLLKVARSDFWLTIPFNFDQLLYHHQESDRKSIVIAELKKDQSFRWDKFCPNRSYHSNGMTSYPFYIILNNWSSRENFGKRFTDLVADILVLRSAKFEEFLRERFRENLGRSFQAWKNNKEITIPKCYWNICPHCLILVLNENLKQNDPFDFQNHGFEYELKWSVISLFLQK